MKMETLQEQTDRLSSQPVVSHDEWMTARKELVRKEKELTDMMDAVAEERRRLPWELVEKDYTFRGPRGTQTLSELFDGRSQLIIYHFMFAPDWEEGCPGCSFLADHIDGPNLHLSHHDVSFVVVSRGPIEKLEAYKKRMGWKFHWVSSADSDFNFDYQASFSPEQVSAGKAIYNFETLTEEDCGGMTELPGTSVFYKDEKGRIYHTYSSYSRAGDIFIGAHQFLDVTPKGRNERTIMDWVRRHDKYEDKGAAPEKAVAPRDVEDTHLDQTSQGQSPDNQEACNKDSEPAIAGKDSKACCCN
ncbi:MAG TPA: thioredoxin family protein [Candidatus Methylacidiphilales bacterium]|nr:thioredoxin family protein [Candidatus Methylacidiphilales bacterium]